MTIRKELAADSEILRKNPEILIYWIFGVILIVASGTVLYAEKPNPQIGFSLVALGFAFVTYGLNKFSSIESGKKIINILTEIQADLKEFKKRDHQDVNLIQTEEKKRRGNEIKNPSYLEIVGIIIGAIIALLSSYYLFWKHEK
ncbi:MAG: hypothetical protein ABSE07_08335 [Methanoregula sp.]|jgi:hypothetical protein